MTNAQSKFKKFQDDIVAMTEYGWDLKIQPPLPGYEDVPFEEWKVEHFGILDKVDRNGVEYWRFPTFKKGEHLTWQQGQQLLYINKSKQGGQKKIAVAAGRGIGKTFTESLIIHWALLQARYAQGAATSYSRDLIYSILWKELAKAHRKAKPEFKKLFVWSATRFAIAESPEAWFIDARTGKKENPEALAGVHGPFVLLLADEASGVPVEIFETALDGLTELNYLMYMASNWRRLTGFFNDQCELAKSFLVLQYNSLHSPLYNVDRAVEIAEEDPEGIESDRYRVEVLGLSPNKEGADDDGYVPIVNPNDIQIADESEFAPVRRLGVDPAGKGSDEAVWVVRDKFKAQVVGREKVSTGKGIAAKTLTFMNAYGIPIDEVFIDSFGVGAEACMELAGMYPNGNPNAVNVGESARDKERFINMRAEAFWEVRKWLKTGGALVRGGKWGEIITIKFKNNQKGKLQIMPKDMMRKKGIKSPNDADALMLTFTKEETEKHEEVYNDDYIDEYGTAYVNPYN